jgi:CPA2 family monovalent cation:H+ antiporter-2
MFQLEIMQTVIWVGAFLLCLPFLIGLTRNINDIVFGVLGNFASDHIKNKQTQARVFGVFRYITTLIVLFFFSGTFLGIAAKYLPSGISIATFGLAIVIIGMLLWRRISTVNSRLEHTFIASFNYKIETREQKQRALILKRATEKYPWPVAIGEVVLRPNYDVVGSRISDIGLRSRAGATIIAITRAGCTDYNPRSETMLFPSDRIILLGEQSQLSVQGPYCQRRQVKKNVKKSEFNLDQVCIGKCEGFVGKVLGQINLRKTYGVSVVGIQRDSEKIVDISAETELQENDILLLTGSDYDIRELKSKLGIEQPA